MTNAEWVFARAIHLMDEQNESTGETKTADTKEYRLRTLSILNILRNELYPYSDTYEQSAGRKRPVCQMIATFEEDIGLDDVLAQGILPYGLAAHLLLGENDALASFFNQRYMELINTLAAKAPSEWESIEPAYGSIVI